MLIIFLNLGKVLQRKGVGVITLLIFAYGIRTTNNLSSYTTNGKLCKCIATEKFEFSHQDLNSNSHQRNSNALPSSYHAPRKLCSYRLSPQRIHIYNLGIPYQKKQVMPIILRFKLFLPDWSAVIRQTNNDVLALFNLPILKTHVLHLYPTLRNFPYF